jgi:endonuclease/exonuclease/phosphatase family metal-dependent hydrolase
MSKICEKDQIKSIVSQRCVSKSGHIGKIMSYMRKHLQKQNTFVKALPQYLKNSLIWYTNDFNYKKFNSSIRKGEQLTAEYTYNKNNLEQIFRDIPPIESPIRIYRGMKGKDYIQTDKTFTSATLSKKVTKDFIGDEGCCLLEIILDKDSKVVPLYWLSDYVNEMEVLIDRYSEVTILEKLSRTEYLIRLTKPLALTKNDTEFDFKNFETLQKNNLFYNLEPNVSPKQLKKVFREYSRTSHTIPPHQKTGRMRVMTYNIHNGFRNIEDTKSSYVGILNNIRTISPDVLCLQEVTFDEVSKIEFLSDMERVGYVSYTLCKAEDLYNNGFFGNMIFYKGVIQSDTTISLPRDKEKQCATVAWIDDIQIVNVHLDAWDYTEETHIKQIKKILGNINEKAPTIILGDFNTTREEDYTKDHLIWILKNHGFRGKPFPTKALGLFKENGYTEIFDGMPKVSITNWTGKRLDYIFVKGLTPINSFVYYEESSDHFPVIADF